MRKILLISFLCQVAFVSNSLAASAPSGLSVSITSTTPPVWNFDVPRGVSRATGVAPLSVHFSAGLTASSPGKMPFHDYEYSWNFGDSTIGTWGTSGKSKNIDKGPVAAHVYETPGTYIATLTVRDALGVVDTQTFTTTVHDPNTIFAGTKTTCISTTADFAGCPAGASQVTTSNLSGLSGYTDAGERVLLKRGDSWTVGSAISFPNNSGPVHIGAFGTCSSPDAETGICSNAPKITLPGSSSFIEMNQKSNWRVADLSIIGTTGTTGYAIGGGWNTKDNLIIRAKISGSNYGISWSNWRNNDDEYVDNNAIVSSLVSNVRDYAVYIGGERLMIMGNRLQDVTNQHVLRVWQLYQGVISHNIISGASLSHGGQQALKLHGPTPLGSTGQTFVGTYAQTSGTEGNGLRNYTQFSVVANNIVGGSGPWPVCMGPQNGTYAERLSDLIFEKNRVISDYRLQTSGMVDIPVYFSGSFVTARNNIIDIGLGGNTGVFGMDVRRTGAEPYPTGMRIYNNTIYSQGGHSNGAVAIRIQTGATDVVVRNNYASFPNTANKTMFVDNSGNAIGSNNVMTNSPAFIDPNNSSPLTRNFKITSSANLAIGQGIAVPVFEDYLGKPNTSPYSLGAYLP